MTGHITRRREALGFVVLLVSISSPAAAQSDRLHRYVSPDHALTAVVTAVSSTREDSVQILNASGMTRLERSFASSDGEHGVVIEKATWSPDSEFFVFSGYSSGGHQPWRAPLFIYGRARNTIYELDKCVPGIAVVESGFEMVAPHLVRVTVASFSHGLGEDHRSETYDLRDVVHKCQIKDGASPRDPHPHTKPVRSGAWVQL